MAAVLTSQLFYTCHSEAGGSPNKLFHPVSMSSASSSYATHAEKNSLIVSLQDEIERLREKLEMVIESAQSLIKDTQESHVSSSAIVDLPDVFDIDCIDETIYKCALLAKTVMSWCAYFSACLGVLSHVRNSAVYATGPVCIS